MLEQGIHYDVPMRDYVLDPAPAPSLSKGTMLTLLETTPALAFHNHPRLGGGAEESNSSRADLGTLAHQLVLGGTKRVRVLPDEFADYRKGEARQLRDEAWAEGALPVLAHEFEEVKNMASMMEDALVRAGLWTLDRKSEGTMIWLEEETGVWKRGRFDLWLPEQKILVDIKSATDANPVAWSKRVLSAGGYDLQSEHYSDGIERLTGLEPGSVKFLFLVCELTAPYGWSLVDLDEVYKSHVRRKIERATEIWADCMMSGKWPGYPESIHHAEANPWEVANFAARHIHTEEGGEA